MTDKVKITGWIAFASGLIKSSLIIITFLLLNVAVTNSFIETNKALEEKKDQDANNTKAIIFPYEYYMSILVLLSSELSSLVLGTLLIVIGNLKQRTNFEYNRFTKNEKVFLINYFLTIGMTIASGLMQTLLSLMGLRVQTEDSNPFMKNVVILSIIIGIIVPILSIANAIHASLYAFSPLPSSYHVMKEEEQTTVAHQQG
ncbi:hypothetical protein ABK040_007371 [Willaertia magna]